MREVASKVGRNLGVVGRARKLFDWSRMLKGCFNAYVLSSLEYCAPVWMPSADSHLRLLDSSVHCAERLCEGELCSLGHRRKVSALYLLYKIYHRVDHLMNEYRKHLVAARNTRGSAALGELVFVIPHSRTDQFSCSILRAAVRQWNVLPSGVFSGGTLGSLKSAVNSYFLRA